MFGMGTTAKAKVLDRIEVPIFNDKGNNQAGRPKAPEFIPIFCQYEGGQLFFGFYFDLDAVIVNVTNENTGEQWQAVLQSSGTESMNVSEGAGSYHIEITTMNNKVYYGEYQIL